MEGGFSGNDRAASRRERGPNASRSRLARLAWISIEQREDKVEAAVADFDLGVALLDRLEG